MTPARLAEIRAMLDNITPGEWKQARNDWSLVMGPENDLIMDRLAEVYPSRFVRREIAEANAAFIAAAPGIVRELLVEIERLQSGFDWLSGQEVSISDFTAPCQCKNEYLQNEECSKGINPDDVCPYYNHRGTGECWVDYIKNIATAKEKS